MIKWLRKILGISDVEKGIVCLHTDMNKAFNRISRLEKTTRQGKRGSRRYDQIERDRKNRRKLDPLLGAP